MIYVTEMFVLLNILLSVRFLLSKKWKKLNETLVGMPFFSVNLQDWVRLA